MTYKKKRTPMEFVYITIALLVGLIFVLSLVGDDIKITYEIPDNAVVYCDSSSKIYYAPPYIDNNRYPSNLDVSSLKAQPVSAARIQGYTADPVCTEQNYFREQDTLNHVILWKLGLAGIKPSRWNADGSWNF